MSSTEVERLIVVFDAKFDALDQKIDKIVAKNEAAAKKVTDAWAKQPLGAAIKSLADDVGEAATKLPGLGAALEAIGPAGLAATVAVGAFLAVLEEGKKALEFGDNIAKAAEKIGISTTTLQEYRFVVTATGGSTEEADAAMLKFQQTLGQASLGATKAKLAFNALHLDSQALAKEGLDKALDTTIDALSRVGSEAQRQGIAAKLGLEPFIAAIREGPEAVAELKAAILEGGGIMPAEAVEQARSASVQLEAIGQTAKVTLTTAFVKLAPLILTVAEYLALATKFATDFAEEIGHEVSQAFRDSAAFFDKWNKKFADWSAQLEQAIPFLKVVEDALNGINAAATGAGAKGHAAAANAPEGSAQAWMNKEFGTVIPTFKTGMEKVMAEVAKQAGTAKGQGTLAAGSLARPHATPADKTQQLLQDATAALANAMKAELQSTLALTTNIDDRAQIEQGIAEQEFAAALAELEKKRAAAAKDKTLKDPAVKAAINADIDEAETAQANAEVNKVILEQRQAQVAHLQAANAQASAEAALRAVSFKAQEDEFTARANLAVTTAERNSWEQQALKAAQARETDAAQQAVDTAQNAYDQALAMNDFDKALKAATDLLKARTEQTALGRNQVLQTAQQVKAQENPLQKWADDAQNFSQTVMDDGAKAFSSLADGLADAIVHAKNLGDVAKNVFQQLAVDLVSALLKKEIATYIFPYLPAFASGGIAAGGLALVGERGPEIVNLPGGSQVIPNSALRSVGLGSMSPAPPTILFDNRGAVIWEQAARQMMAYADRTSASAGFASLQTSRRSVPAEMARASGRTLR